MQFQTLPITQINPATYNPRVDLQPGDPRYDRLAKSIDEFGLVEPLVWNQRSGNLVGGHQRLKILVARGDTEVQVVAVDLPPEREKALNLALNKIQGDWDLQKLNDLLQELIQIPDLDLELTGFDLDESQDILAEVLDGAGIGRGEEFDVEAELAAAGPVVTKPGDLLVLGVDPARQHRLLCGDCTDAAQVRRLMDGQLAALFATDPPYLVDYDGTNHPGSKQAKTRRGALKDGSASHGVTWDDASANPDLYDRFVRAAVAEAIASHAAWYCWHASRRQAMLEQAWNIHGAFVHTQIIWVKNRAVPTRAWYFWQHEPCLMGWLKGHMPRRVDKRHLSTVWSFDTLSNGAERPDHPTPKPPELFEIPLRQHTRPGEIAYEPFAGSGTQFIAAERLGRRCYGLEISPRYCDLIVRRYIAFVGEYAVPPEVAARYRRRDVRVTRKRRGGGDPTPHPLASLASSDANRGGSHHEAP
ncbi:MAG: DNA modification methylase [Phycisphaeraceae bacterium]|nr:DNA modification methylase [Phycisphaeraceae bacterium]